MNSQRFISHPIITLLTFLLLFVSHTAKSLSLKQYPAIIDQQLLNAESYIAKLGIARTPYLVIINIAKQNLTLYHHRQQQATYAVSTSKLGQGQIKGSKQTPLGLHIICEKIGDGAPTYAIFKGRTLTGKIWPTNTPRGLHLKDHIITRILRLEGLEPNFNHGMNYKGQIVDSKQRLIYIHGTTMEWKIGTPAGRGCIHLSPTDLVELFNIVPTGTQVLISSV